ncbi:hypothetical protein K449DRAFT_382075 [Hypoxylon sp. EC38]|nr:hypothetical protein K449DRAFT_382075 [Hypoxylon sp. EC38]
MENIEENQWVENQGEFEKAKTKIQPVIEQNPTIKTKRKPTPETRHPTPEIDQNPKPRPCTKGTSTKIRRKNQ